MDSDSAYHYIEYLRHGEEHKLDGPAELWGDNYRLYYEYGQLVSSRKNNESKIYNPH